MSVAQSLQSVGTVEFPISELEDLNGQYHKGRPNLTNFEVTATLRAMPMQK